MLVTQDDTSLTELSPAFRKTGLGFLNIFFTYYMTTIKCIQCSFFYICKHKMARTSNSKQVTAFLPEECHLNIWKHVTIEHKVFMVRFSFCLFSLTQPVTSLLCPIHLHTIISDMTGAFMVHNNTQHLWMHTQDLHKIKPADTPAMMREQLMKSHA